MACAGCYTGHAMDYSIARGSFAGLEQEWRELLPQCPNNHVFLTPEWQSAWWRAFGGDDALMLFSVQRDGELVGVVPFMRQGAGLSFIGSPDVCDYMDFIAREGEEKAVMSLLLDRLAAMSWESIALHSLLPRSLALAHFVPEAERRGYRVDTTVEDVSPQLVLPSTWDGYMSLLAKKQRHELRRKLRRLDQTRSASFHSVTDRGGIVAELECFFRLFELSEGEKAGFMTEERRAFFETMVRALAARGYVRLWFLEIGRVRAATVLCFDYGNDLYLYNSGYDSEYSSLSAGLILKVHCLEQGIVEGKRRFDFLRGSEPYKYNLGAEDVLLYRCVISRS
ncbi:MAG: GNAT family N-acetyltransferase [Chloroflexota bacterium]|nr:GNAT family N-acetyltransferase [Chloroflexota bacterium]